MNAQTQTSTTIEFVVDGETCAAVLSTSPAGYVTAQLQMPDESTYSIGNRVYPNEDRGVAAATRSAERIITGQPRMPALRKKGL